MNNKKETVLVTGASGMIGAATVAGLLSAGYCVVGIDLKDCAVTHENYKHLTVDLSDYVALKNVIRENSVDRVIHLAALAHENPGNKYTWEDYLSINVECSKNVFQASKQLPVLFISTVDVYGFTRKKVNALTLPKPVSHYAKSKFMAEKECRKLSCYTIFRLSPVYTDTVKRDIQKRYYLKYPAVAYKIGKGTEYEILNIKKAVASMVEWCDREPENDVCIIKDDVRMNTVDYIAAEKSEGRAKLVLCVPQWMVKAGYTVFKAVTGENKYTYLLNKAVYPLRSE